MKPLFYLLLVICFSTIFSCKKEKIAQTPTPASPTTIVPNATVQQLAGVWRLVKQEVYDNNVLFYSYDSTEINTYTTSMNNNIPYPPSFIEFTTVLSYQSASYIYNYNVLYWGIYSTLGFWVTLSGDPDDSQLINTSIYDKFGNTPLALINSLPPESFYLNNPNNPPFISLTLSQMDALQQVPSTDYIRVLDAHNLVVSSWGDNVFADGIKSYYCR